MLLTIDGGNSAIQCYRHGEGARSTFGYGEDAADHVARLLAAADRCAAVCVVERAREIIADASRRAGVPVRFAGAELPCPLRLDYETPETLGADRWVAAFAAHAAHGRCVVVDAGSATTVDLVEADGTFRGGAIAPGVGALVRGAAIVTPFLPPADAAAMPGAAPAVPPASTQEAVDAGLFLGYAGLVDRLVDELQRAAAGPATVVLTGGWAAGLAGHVRFEHRLDPVLIHRGLRLLDER